MEGSNRTLNSPGGEAGQGLGEGWEPGGRPSGGLPLQRTGGWCLRQEGSGRGSRRGQYCPHYGLGVGLLMI